MNAPQTIDPLHTKTCQLDGGDPEKKREEIRAYFHQTFSLYERLFDCLASEEAYYTKATPLRHPLIFYYGHTAVFFINNCTSQADPRAFGPAHRIDASHRRG